MAYGIKYKCDFSSDIEGVNYSVRILKKDYNSAVLNIKMGGNPVQINYTNGSENKFEVIRGSECVINFFADYENQFEEIMIADNLQFRLEIYKNGSFFWGGFVIQDNYSEPFQAVPYLVSIRATDGLGSLKQYSLKQYDNSLYVYNMSLISILLRCLSNLKNGTQLISSIDVYERNINRSINSNESLNNVLINPFYFLDKDDETISCDEIVKGILNVFNAYIYYENGKYFIERINYKAQNNLTRRTYSINFEEESSTSCSVTSDSILSEITKTGILKFINSDQNITYQTPYRSVVINSEPAITEKIIVNPYFRKWNSSNTLPINWLKSGTFDIEKVPYPYTGDALKVNTVTLNDSSINYNTNYLKTEKTLYNGLASDKDTLTVNISYVGYVRLMVKVVTLTGLQYLRSETINNEIVYSWTSTPSHLKLKNETRSGVRPPIGGSSELTWSNVSEATLPIPYDVNNKIEAYLLPAYSGSTYQIREFQINYNVDKDFGGLVYSQKSNKAHTDVYDLEAKQGEFSSNFILNQLYIGTGTTENWYREDKPSENFSLLYLTSKSILNQTRTPFKKFTGSFIGDFNIGDIYSIEGLNGRFIPLKASTDLKSETHNIDFYELLNEVDDSNDTFTRLLQYDKGYQIIDNTSSVQPVRPYRPT